MNIVAFFMWEKSQIMLEVSLIWEKKYRRRIFFILRFMRHTAQP